MVELSDFLFLRIAGFVLLYSLLAVSLYTMNRIGLSSLRGYEGSSGCFVRGAQRVLENIDHYLLATQVGIFLSVLYGGILLVDLGRYSLWIGQAICNALGLSCNSQVAALALVILVLALTWITFFVTQTFKAIVSYDLQKALCALSIPIIIFSWILSPLTLFISVTGRSILRIFRVSFPVEYERIMPPEQISEIVELSTEAGQMEEGESEMIQSVFALSDTVVREVMTPRKDIIYVHENASLESIAHTFVIKGKSRIIVVGKDMDDIKGILIAKDLVPFLSSYSGKFQMNEVMRKAIFVPETKKVDELLHEFRLTGLHIALVVDEHGTIQGLVSMEDILEQLVGDITDEFDVRKHQIREIENGEILVEGDILIQDLNENANLSLPLGDYDTLAGFLLDTLGRIPRKGEEIKCDGYALKIEDIEQNRIKTVRIIPRNQHLSLNKQIDSFEPKPLLSDSKEWGTSVTKTNRLT